MEKYRKQCAAKGLPTTDEAVVLFAMFPQQVEELFKPKAPGQATPAAAPAPVARPPTPVAGDGQSTHLFVTVNGTRHDVTVETLKTLS